MALESFYGGKPGYSPIIKNTFKYISEDDTRYQNLTNNQKNAALQNHEVMNSCFQDPTYTDVWYGELCIIASDSMYDSNNGKIFRRTLKKQSSEDELYSNLYAEYLGQIVGMPGGLPKVVFTKIDDIKTKAETATNDIWYPTGIETGSNFIQTSNQPITDSSSYPYVFQNSEGIELVPGKDKNGNYNDYFEYTWLQVLNPETNSNNSESDGTAATIDMGVKIPYLTIEPEAKSVSYTNGANARIEETNTDINGIEHPFYRKYTFFIPDGVRGIGIRNLRIETKASLEITGSNNIVLDPSQNIFNYDENNREITIDTETEENYYTFDTTKYGENSPFWVYDLIVPKRSDPSLNSTTSYICYAGDYNEVANVELNSNGTLTFNRNYGNPISTTSKLKWITGVEVDTDLTKNDKDNTDYGKFTISYNEGYNSENYTLPLVKKVIVSPNIDSNGETINVDLATSGDRTKRLTLQKEVVSTDNNNNDSISYTDYILKYPTKVNIRSAIIDTEDPENSEDDHFFYLTATYNDSTVENLGKVGLTSVSHLGYTLGVKELDSTLYFPSMEEYLVPDSPILIKEDIDFGTLDFPSFTI